MDIYKELTFAYAKDADIKRENANIDADTAMGTMLKYGSEGVQIFHRQLYPAQGHCRRPHQRRHPYPRQGFLHADRDLLPDRPAQAVPQRLFHRSRLPCGSPTAFRAIPPWPASPSRPTRTRCTAARACPTSIIPWRRVWRRPLSRNISRALAAYFHIRLGLSTARRARRWRTGVREDIPPDGFHAGGRRVQGTR